MQDSENSKRSKAKEDSAPNSKNTDSEILFWIKNYFWESFAILVAILYILFLLANPLSGQNERSEITSRQENIHRLVDAERAFYKEHGRYAEWPELSAYLQENSLDHGIKEPTRIYGHGSAGVAIFDQYTIGNTVFSSGARAIKKNWIYFCSKNIVETC